jgi:hypothetical protein
MNYDAVMAANASEALELWIITFARKIQRAQGLKSIRYYQNCH